jgi:ribosomal protein S12 methylthiotransferase accessory factor YcaO
MKGLMSNSISSGFHLRSRKKHITSASADDLTRARSIEDTLAEIVPLCTKIGVTRISDISFMDKLRIPNYSAILPGTADIIWVYGGKGTTKSHAKASALMEAIERYSSLSSSYAGTFVQGSYLQLSQSYNKVLHPAEVVEPVDQEYNDEEDMMDFLPGFDLLTNEEVLVPAEIALYRHSPEHAVSCAFTHSHTNGLASGNVVEEAICHALCEVIERDAVSIADLCASCIPYNILDTMINSLKKEERYGNLLTKIPVENIFVDDASIFPDVDISEIAGEFEPIRCLVKRFTDSGVPLLIKDITQKDIGIPTILASSPEWITHDYGYFAKGYGTHPDARIALIRAITELSQTRAANIQGARDDLKKIQYKEDDEIEKRKWQFMPALSPLAGQINSTKSIIEFSEIRTSINEDIKDDIKLILHSLNKARLKRAIIVDLTNPSIGIPVIRAIVPGLETFEVTKSVMGSRAREYFRKIQQP